MHSYSVLEKGISLKHAEKAFIFLHGRGGSAEDIMQLNREFRNENYYYAAPQASNRTWYPFSFLSPVAKNEPWLGSAIDVIKQLRDDILKEISSENLYIMGFSQGAYLALEFSARYAIKYGGIVAFTGGLIGEFPDRTNYTGTLNRTKIFIGNSDNDPHVPISRSRESKEILESLDADVQLSIYPGMPHIITKEEIVAVKELMEFL